LNFIIKRNLPGAEVRNW